MRLFTLFLLAVPMFGQVAINTQATIQNAAVAPFRALIQADFPAADANNDGVVSNAEGLACLSTQKIQKDLVEHYVKVGVLRAETADPTLLPQAYRDALAAKAAAEASIQAQRELLCPGCW